MLGVRGVMASQEGRARCGARAADLFRRWLVVRFGISRVRAAELFGHLGRVEGQDGQVYFHTAGVWQGGGRMGWVAKVEPPLPCGVAR